MEWGIESDEDTLSPQPSSLSPQPSGLPAWVGRGKDVV